MEDGTNLWKGKSVGDGHTLLAVHGDKVYAVQGKTLTVFNSGTGKVLKALNLPVPINDRILGDQIIAGRMILQAENKTYVINPKRGKVIFMADHPIFVGNPSTHLAQKPWKDSFDLIHNRGFFIHEKQLVAVDLKKGRVVWKTSVPYHIFGAPSYSKGRVTIAGPKVFLGVNADTGKVEWIDTDYEGITITSPYLLYTHSRDRFTAEVGDGFVTHHTKDKGRNYFYPIPDDTTLMFARKSSFFFLYRYIEQDSGLNRSVILRMNYKTAQLHGRRHVEGKSTGLFVHSKNRIFSELVPGYIYELSVDEVEIEDHTRLSERPLLFLDIVGHKIVAVTAGNKVICLQYK